MTIARNPELSVLISGSREINASHVPTIELAVEAAAKICYANLTRPAPVRPPMELHHGAADGADTLFAQAAARHPNFTPVDHPAQWGTHRWDLDGVSPLAQRAGVRCCPESHRGLSKCRMAGHRRNAEMIALGHRLLIAMPAHPRSATAGSRGTWGQIDAARRIDAPTLLLWNPEPSHPARLYWGDEATHALLLAALPDGHPRSDRGHPHALRSVDLRAFVEEPPF